jgi:hypothetical protein
MLVIPIQPVPSQQVLCVLDNQNCQIAIYQKNCKIYVDLNSNGVNMCIGALAHNAVPLDSCNSYDGFSGNLYFIDTQGLDDPQFAGFNSRWYLVYLTAEEVLLTAPDFSSIAELSGVLALSATLEVTSPNAGNFEVAHGLDTVPFLIEIVPTSAGAIWGQAGFADDTNIYLAASDVGVTATVYVYTMAAAGLTTQAPAATLLVDSPSQPPDTFSVAHGLGVVPALVEILPTSPGTIWEAAAADSTNLHLAASSAGVTATVSVYKPPSEGPFNIEAPATTLGVTSVAALPFSVPHGLSAAPSRIEILMISAGSIWAQTPAFDGANVYLQASDVGVIAKILVYA